MVEWLSQSISRWIVTGLGSGPGVSGPKGG
jgi:hypothetical protein